jgi:hypothetical protein
MPTAQAWTPREGGQSWSDLRISCDDGRGTANHAERKALAEVETKLRRNTTAVLLKVDAFPCEHCHHHFKTEFVGKEHTVSWREDNKTKTAAIRVGLIQYVTTNEYMSTYAAEVKKDFSMASAPTYVIPAVLYYWWDTETSKVKYSVRKQADKAPTGFPAIPPLTSFS